jgi:UDP-N-acetylmuramoyl-tripeptide--D-alanyl-D-alanine ligase
LNNDIGVPLTLMRLSAEHDAGVFELGANRAGEIDYLASLAQPTVGVITNAAAAHLEGFGSLGGVCLAKGELLDHLPRAGTAVLNADDQFRGEWVARSRCEFTVTFGFAPSADCRVLGEPHYLAAGSEFRMRLPDGDEADVWLPLLGRQNVANALAAAAATQAIGASIDDIVAGLARAAPVRGRLRAVPGRGGATIIDDSYNANPGSVHAALDHLAALRGRRIFVFGNMAELGPTALELHQEIGEYARGRCDALFAIGDLAAEAAKAFGAEGRRVPDVEAARDALEPLLGDGVTVLVKGSRVMGLDRLVRQLEAEAPGERRC